MIDNQENTPNQKLTESEIDEYLKTPRPIQTGLLLACIEMGIIEQSDCVWYHCNNVWMNKQLNKILQDFGYHEEYQEEC